jgi:apolipoprotein N-acyltransferase
VAGLLLTASLPPFGWWPLALVGAGVLARSLAVPLGWRGRLAVGGGAGLGLYGPALWWVTEFHAVGWVVIVLLEGAILALALLAVGPAPGRGAATARLAVALPAGLVLAEAVRGRWPFGGLPLGGIDLGQAGGPLLPVARLGGHLMVVGAVGLAGVGLAAVASRRWVPAAACTGLVVALVMAGRVATSGSDQGGLRVAAVQGGGPRGTRAVDTDPSVVLEAHLAASDRLATGAPVDLVVWPEDVVDVDRPLPGSPEEAAVAAVARRLGVPLIAGVVEDVAGELRFRNAAVVFAADGRVVDRYDKVHRVPFGEYIPYRSLIERVADTSVVPRDAVAGQGAGVVDTPVGRLAVAISFEVFFADRASSGVAAGGRLLLVPTNASSYSTSQVPTQELAAARLRAVETGRWLVQAAPTGYTAFVDEDGRVRVQGPLGDRVVLRSEVRLRTGRTLAVRLGDLPIALGAVVLLALTHLRTRKVE